MPATTPSSAGGLDLSFIKSLFGSNTTTTTATTTTTTTMTTTPTEDAILNQTLIPPPAIPTTPQQQEQIEQPQPQQKQSHIEHRMEKQQQCSSQHSSAKWQDPLEQRSLPQEQHKSHKVEQNPVHSQSDACLPSPSTSQPPHPPSRKKEGKRQRVNRLRQKRKAIQQDSFDNNNGKPNDDLDFDGLLALHETKGSDTTKSQSAKNLAKNGQSTTSHPSILSTANQTGIRLTNPTADSSLTTLVDQSLGSTQSIFQSSSAKSTSSTPTKKSDLSTQDAAFLSNLLDSLSKGNSVSELPPPRLLPQQDNMATQQAKNGHQSNANQKQTSTKRKNGQKGSMTKKQKVNSGNVDSAPSANGKSSMTDIANDILGNTRKQPYKQVQQKQRQNHLLNKGGQYQGRNNQQMPKGQKQHPSSSSDSNNNKNAPLAPTVICKYYARGHCAQGDGCKFKHEGKQNLTLCKFYKGGNCGNGVNCTFSHDLQLEPCRFFFVGGSCDAGDHCVFSHAPLTDDARKELHKMTGPCRFYHFKGYCAKGNECVFSHTEIADDKRHELELTLTPCRHFHTQRVCPKGDDCFYLHEEAPAESVRLLKETLAKQEQQQQKQQQQQKHYGTPKRPHFSPTKQLSSPLSTPGSQLYPSVIQHASSPPPPRPFSNQLPPMPLSSRPPAPRSHFNSFASGEPCSPTGSSSLPRFDPRLARSPPPLQHMSRDPRMSTSNYQQQQYPPPPPQNNANNNHR